MASKPDCAGWPTWVAATALSLVFWWLATGLHPLWWAAWLAPIPVLWLATRVPAPRAAAAAFLASALASFSVWSYYHNVIKLPVAVLVFAMTASAVIFTLALLLYRRLNIIGRPLAAMMAVPVLWTALGFVNAQLSPNGTWGNLSYSQMNAPILIQIAALTGLWGIGFLVLLVAAGVASMANRNTSSSMRVCVAGLTAVVMVLALSYGGWRLHSTNLEPHDSVLVGLAAMETTGTSPQLGSVKGQELSQRYAAAIKKLASDGAQVVVLPEKVWSLNQASAPALAQLAQRHSLTLVAGVVMHRHEHEYNMALALDGHANESSEYTKHHLVTGWERAFTPGSGYTTLVWLAHTGLAICKDMDFPAMGRSYAKRDVRLLLVPAWDFGTDSWLHSRMAILRGVESGFAIARTARDGTLTLSDDRGRVLAETPSNLGADAVLLGTLPLRRDRTLYARWGNWFAWLDLAGLLVLLGLALRPARL
ncbi:MAG: nitrilase-related carbon-nitrogen hydrolase [Gammaproteobacteria bacterium]